MLINLKVPRFTVICRSRHAFSHVNLLYPHWNWCPRVPPVLSVCQATFLSSVSVVLLLCLLLPTISRAFLFSLCLFSISMSYLFMHFYRHTATHRASSVFICAVFPRPCFRQFYPPTTLSHLPHPLPLLVFLSFATVETVHIIPIPSSSHPPFFRVTRLRNHVA